MKKRMMVMIGFCFIVGSCLTNEALGRSLLHYISMKVTIINNGIEYQYEFQSPDEFEYEKGHYVTKDAKAKQKVEEMFQTLNLHEKADMSEMVSALQKLGFNQLERVDIRLVNDDEKLYTWVWEKP